MAKKPASKKSAAVRDDLLKEALRQYDASYQKERDNIDAAYDDMRFRAGEQWPAELVQSRLADGKRPCLTINMLPQFIRQVTGDIRQMRPAIKVIPVSDGADEEKAEIRQQLIRYIETRSEAQAVYFAGADSQVTCGIGHWRVTTEYASSKSFNLEIRIDKIQDQIGVLWDADSISATREDAMHCFVPVDMTVDKFKSKYPDKSVDSFPNENDGDLASSWFGVDTIRVAEYWVKKVTKSKKSMDLKTGAAVDYAGEDDDDDDAVRDREDYEICRYVISGNEVLEGPVKWPGKLIPIVPIIGEEVNAGKTTVRHGVIRFAKDPQRIYNYMRSAQVEIKALQPKAPFMVTEKQVADHIDFWRTSNSANHPFIPYTPDPLAPGAPQRAQPPVTSPGITEEVALSANDMKAVIGIYDAQLGARSNETSGVAIRARQSEGDTGTFLYKDNFARAIRQTARVINDLIPSIYDTARTLRIIGEDGKMEKLEINTPQGLEIEGQPESITNDVTVGEYDIAVEMGPAYATMMQEAREGMAAFMQASPNTAPLILDLVAKAQDWPMKDRIAERLETMLPPEVRQKEKENDGNPQPPTEAEMMAAEEAQKAKQMQDALMMAELRLKNAQAAKAEAEAMAAGMPQGEQQQGPDIAGEAQKADMVIKASLAELDMEIKQAQVEAAQLENAMKRMQFAREMEGGGEPQVDPRQEEMADLDLRAKRVDVSSREKQAVTTETKGKAEAGEAESRAAMTKGMGEAMAKLSAVIQKLDAKQDALVKQLDKNQKDLVDVLAAPKSIIYKDGKPAGVRTEI